LLAAKEARALATANFGAEHGIAIVMKYDTRVFTKLCSMAWFTVASALASIAANKDSNCNEIGLRVFTKLCSMAWFAVASALASFAANKHGA